MKDINELDHQVFIDPETGKQILFMFEDEHHLVIDVCQYAGEEHESCELLSSTIIEI